MNSAAVASSEAWVSDTSAIERAAERGLVLLVVFFSAGLLNEFLRIGGPEGRAINQVALTPIFILCTVAALYRIGDTVRISSSSPLLLALLLTPVASIAWSVDTGQTVNRVFAFWISAACAMFIAGRFSIRELLRLVAIGALLTALANYAYVVVFPGEGIMQGGHSGAWRGIYSQKNGLARAMVVGTIACVFAARDARGGLRAVLGAGALLCLGLVVLSTSKTALVVLGAVGIAVGFVQLLRARGAVVIGAVLLSVLGVAAVLSVAALYADEAASLLGRDLTLTGRTIIWVAALAELASRPLTGFGYGAFWTGWDGPGATVWVQVGWDPGDSHNGFLDAALDLGVIGVGLLIVQLLAISAYAVRWARESKSAAMWPIAFIVTFLLYNLTESSTFRPTNLLWVLYLTLSLQLATARKRSAPTLTTSPGDGEERA